VVVSVTDQIGGGPWESPDETTCGNEDFAGDLLGKVAGQVDIGRCGVVRCCDVQRACIETSSSSPLRFRSAMWAM